MVKSKAEIIEQLKELNDGVINEDWLKLPVYKLLAIRDTLKADESSSSDEDEISITKKIFGAFKN
jgi:hypothetical protein